MHSHHYHRLWNFSITLKRNLIPLQSLLTSPHPASLTCRLCQLVLLLLCFPASLVVEGEVVPSAPVPGLAMGALRSPGLLAVMEAEGSSFQYFAFWSLRDVFSLPKEA